MGHTMKVLRVERRTGLGPYQWNNELRYPFPDGPPCQPYAASDFALPPGTFIDTRLRFGFCNMAQLRAWFDDARRAWLREHDFLISVYEIESDLVLKGKSQAAFPLPLSRKIGEYEIV